MRILLSLFAATALAASASTAMAACGHQSVKLEQSVASAPVKTLQEAVTTHEPAADEIKVEETKSE